MQSNRRLRSLARPRPRQIAMYFAKKFTQKSLPDIGRNFGGRDHATVIDAVKQVENNFIRTDSKFADEINRLKKMFK